MEVTGGVESSGRSRSSKHWGGELGAGIFSQVSKLLS